MLWAWVGLAFFGLGALIFLWVLIRPQRLLLDAEGFTVTGGLTRSPKKERWADTTEFFVYRLPRGGRMIGYDYRPGAARHPRMAAFNRRFGAEAALSKGWPKSPEVMAEELNADRFRAIGNG
jgi:hypothetical protein